MTSIALVAVLQALLLCCAQVHSWDTDYCDKELCGSRPHTACNNTGEFGRACGENVELLDLSEELKDYIVERHNVYRNEVARGGLKPKLPKAARMAYMLWDDELEHVASLHSKQCKFKHDRCRNTKTYQRAGQNIGIMKTSTSNINVKAFIKKTIKAWFKEHRYTTLKEVMKYKTPRRRMIGHFTVLATESNNRVGCGIVVWKKRGLFKTNALMVCNYSRTNIRGQPVYRGSLDAGSECKLGTDERFHALCNPEEPIDPNEIFN